LLGALVVLATAIALTTDALLGEFDDPWMNLFSGVPAGLVAWLALRRTARARER
jgi:hypothetical protein